MSLCDFHQNKLQAGENSLDLPGSLMDRFQTRRDSTAQPHDLQVSLMGRLTNLVRSSCLLSLDVRMIQTRRNLTAKSNTGPSVPRHPVHVEFCFDC